MIQYISGRIRLFLLLCGIWGALFFSLANVNSDVWFFPTMVFYVLYRIGHVYILYLLTKTSQMNNELLRRLGKKPLTLLLVFYNWIFLLLITVPLGKDVSLWWRTLEFPTGIESYFASNEGYPDPTDLFSFIFLLLCSLTCCMRSKSLSVFIRLGFSPGFSDLLRFLWPYQTEDSVDLPTLHKREDYLSAFYPDIKRLEDDDSKATVKRGISVIIGLMQITCIPFLLILDFLTLILGKVFLMRMVGDYGQEELYEKKESRRTLFFERIQMYALFLFSSLYILLSLESIYRNLYNIYAPQYELGIVVFTLLIAAIIIIWEGYDNLIETKKIQKQALFDLSKNNKNWMLLYAHQMFNMAQTISDDVYLFKENDKPNLRIDDIQVNAQLLHDSGEKCLDFAQLLSRQPLIETIDLIAFCKQTISAIEDDKKMAALCTDDDIFFRVF